MKGKEDERKRATEKHFFSFFFLRIEQEGDQNGRFQKEEMKIENGKKEEKWRKRKKEDTWQKRQQ